MHIFVYTNSHKRTHIFTYTQTHTYTSDIHTNIHMLIYIGIIRSS